MAISIRIIIPMLVTAGCSINNLTTIRKSATISVDIHTLSTILDDLFIIKEVFYRYSL